MTGFGGHVFALPRTSAASARQNHRIRVGERIDVSHVACLAAGNAHDDEHLAPILALAGEVPDDGRVRHRLLVTDDEPPFDSCALGPRLEHRVGRGERLLRGQRLPPR